MLRHIESAVLSLLLFLAGCASMPAQGKQTVTIEPSGIHEDCLELLSGDTLNYYFEASAPLNFNIHYHEDQSIINAVSKDAVSTVRESFLSGKQQYYCLMWTNSGRERINLIYERTVAKKQ